MKKDEKTFWMPTKPYTLIDAVNRGASATGSVGYAMATSSADYNGHRIGMCFNDYRQYWVAEHYFGERVVHGHGDFAHVLARAVAEWARQGKGATLVVHVTTDEHAAECLKAGLVPHSDEIEKAHFASWTDWRWSFVSTMLGYERRLGLSMVDFLAWDAAKDGDQQAFMDAQFKKRESLFKKKAVGA